VKGEQVAEGLAMVGEAQSITPAIAPVDLDQSPALRLYGKYPPTLKGRKIGVLLASGFDAKVRDHLVLAMQKEGAKAAIIALKVGGVEDSAGKRHRAEMALSGSPSVLFDAVVVLAGSRGDSDLTPNPDAVTFIMDACRHLKAIATAGIPRFAKKAGLDGKVGVVELTREKEIPQFLELARNGRVWNRGF
jgi:catalase